MKPAHRMERIFRRAIGDPGIARTAARVESFWKARNIVQYFYYHLAFLAVLFLPWWDNFLTRANFSPLWPIAWAGYTTFPAAVNIVRVTFLIGTFAGAFFYRHRLGRIAAFLGIVQFHTLESSFGQPNHQWYPWLYIALLFLFLPDAWGGRGQTREDRKKFLIIFWGAQALFLLTYSMAGLGKFWGALQQFAASQPNAFSPNAFALQIADWSTLMQSRPLLAPFFVAHPLAGWPLYLGALYLQLFAVAAAFRPAIAKLWALGLILFHIGTYLTMDIYFLPPILLLLLLFFDSPFRDPRTAWRNVLFDLPLIGSVIKLSARGIPRTGDRDQDTMLPSRVAPDYNRYERL